MTKLVLELDNVRERRLRELAARERKSEAEVCRDALDSYFDERPEEKPEPIRRVLTAAELLALSPDARRPYLAAAAEDAASLYEADLALPASKRELTALTALDGEPFCD